MRRNKFSEKYGFTNIRDILQKNNIDERLKNRLWNVIKENFFDKINVNSLKIYYEVDEELINKLYDEFFALAKKTDLYLYEDEKWMKKWFFSSEWFEVYNFLEELIYQHHNEKIKENLKFNVNQKLEEEMSAYRFVDDCITPIIEESEIKEIEEVFQSEYNPVKVHLSRALEFLSDRENPDYVNSIKESITSVESIAKIITGKETDLASCLKQMNLDLNKQFVTGMNNIYGWTCKEDGIRHGHTGEELKTSFDEAKYMLVSCSAFINYLISKHEQSKS